MTIPAFLFGLVVSTLYGAAFHLWRGGSFGRMVLYIGLSWAGFWLGHLIGVWQGIDWFQSGPLRLGSASIGSFVVLGVGYWLSLIQVTPEPKKPMKR
jgi:hypothetical protein